MAKRPLPSQEVLRQLLSYLMCTGKLFWKERGVEWFTDQRRSAFHQCALWNSRYAGQEAFTATGSDGYLKGTVLGTYYLAQRIIWKLMAGVDPDEIDHKDGQRQNNAWLNLRNVDRDANARNLAIPSRNTTGAMGVYPVRSRWYASIRFDNKSKHLGVFDTFEEAVTARKAAEVAYGFHPNHGREAAT